MDTGAGRMGATRRMGTEGCTGTAGRATAMGSTTPPRGVNPFIAASRRDRMLTADAAEEEEEEAAAEAEGDPASTESALVEPAPADDPPPPAPPLASPANPLPAPVTLPPRGTLAVGTAAWVAVCVGLAAGAHRGAVVGTGVGSIRLGKSLVLGCE